MDYYFAGDYFEGISYSPFSYFDSSRRGGFSLNKQHKRILVSLVALYISYRLSCFLFRLFSSLYRWATESSESEVQRSPQSRITLLLEATFVGAFGLGIGAVAYYAHQKQSTQLIEGITQAYTTIVNGIVFHTTGFDLSKSSQNANLLVWGTVLSGVIIYLALHYLRFLLYHYIFGALLSGLGIFLYFYQFPITPTVAANYSGSMFIIDRTNLNATLVPALIPKVLLSLTIMYQLFLTLLKSVKLFLKLSFKVLIFTLIAAMLLNFVQTFINEPTSEGAFDSHSTTFTPKHQY